VNPEGRSPADKKPPRTTWKSARELCGTEPPTDDDVPIDLLGNRLDTPEKVRAFIDKLNEMRDSDK
jgi:hypothetical protein